MIIVGDVCVKAAGYTDEEMKMEIAIMLFVQERLSLRKAALMADMHWLNFMKELDKRKIALHYDETPAVIKL